MTPQKKTFFNVWSPQLGNSRNVDVYLPGSYGSARRHPVVYMQDGQNLSDPETAFAGTWRLDATLAALARAGLDPIIVGVHNTEARLAEYSPFPDTKHGGGAGDRYLSFLSDTLKPRIDRLFRTRPSRRDTVIAGSSMGGLISLYAWLSRRDVFGHAAALSPSLWYGRDALSAFVCALAPPAGRLYLDVGTGEGVQAVADVRAMRTRLRAGGLPASRFRYREDPGARHHEEAWSRRLGPALRFLLSRRPTAKR